MRFSIEKLALDHAVDTFVLDCGQAALNRLLKRFAFASQQANASQTYLALADDGVIGDPTAVGSGLQNDEMLHTLQGR